MLWRTHMHITLGSLFARQTFVESFASRHKSFVFGNLPDIARDRMIYGRGAVEVVFGMTRVGSRCGKHLHKRVDSVCVCRLLELHLRQKIG